MLDLMTENAGNNNHPLREMVSYRLARLQAKLNAQAIRILKQTSGLSLTDWRVLVMLETFGQTTSTKIAKEIEFDKGQLSRCLRRLQNAGLVKSTISEEDSRRQLLEFTVLGRETFEKARPHMRARQKQLLDCMEMEEKHMFFRSLEKLEQVADKSEPPNE